MQTFLPVSHFLLLLGYIEVFISYRAKYQYNFFFHLWLLKKEVLFHPNMFSTSYALIFLNVYIYLFGCAGSQLQLGPVGSSSLTRGPTCAPRAGTVGSKPLDHQGSPCALLQCFIPTYHTASHKTELSQINL